MCDSVHRNCNAHNRETNVESGNIADNGSEMIHFSYMSVSLSRGNSSATKNDLLEVLQNLHGLSTWLCSNMKTQYLMFHAKMCSSISIFQKNNPCT